MVRNPRQPERRCISCGRRGPQDSFERLHLAGGDEAPRVEFDVPGRPRQGRGAYVCPRLLCLDRALKKRAFARAFRCSATADEGELRAELARRLEERWIRGSNGR